MIVESPPLSFCDVTTLVVDIILQSVLDLLVNLLLLMNAGFTPILAATISTYETRQDGYN